MDNLKMSDYGIQKDECMTLAVNALFMPVAGSVLEVNETLESTPTLVNAKPYNEGWMLRIRMDDPAEAATLADSAAYLNLLRKG